MTFENTWSFKELDEGCDAVKGTAFRAFKRCELREGRDFYYLDAQAHAGRIEQLKAAGRIYATTVNAVLLTRSGRSRVLSSLNNRDA